MKLESADIREVVRETLAELAADEAKLGTNGDRLGFIEPEAAAALGIQRHVLGDARRRGEISAKRIGKQYVYSRAALVKFLEARE